MWNDDYLDKSLKNNLQNITITCTTKPTISILTVSEVKNYIKVSHDNDDSLIATLIKTSEFNVENSIHKVIHNSTYTQKQQGGCEEIKLMRCPVIGTPTVTYYQNFDSTGKLLTINDDFRIVNNILYSSNNYFYEGRKGDGYVIQYNAGLFTSSTDDNSMEYSVIKTFMLRLIAFLYENRQQFCTQFNEENWSISYNYSDIPSDIKNILLPLRQENMGVL